MESFLVITALGKDRPGIVDKLSETITNCDCNIVDSRMTVLGGEFAVILLVSGKWNQLAKLEDALQNLRDALDLTITSKRTETGEKATNLMPYTVEVISIDHPGIVYELAHFFSKQNINIQELNTTRYSAAHTGTPMFAVHIIANIPADTHVATLRDEFLDFCESQNMDATIEPMKP